MSTSLHTWLAAEMHLADGELLQVAVNRKEFLKLPKREGQKFKPECT